MPADARSARSGPPRDRSRRSRARARRGPAPPPRFVREEAPSLSRRRVRRAGRDGRSRAFPPRAVPAPRAVRRHQLPRVSEAGQGAHRAGLRRGCALPIVGGEKKGDDDAVRGAWCAHARVVPHGRGRARARRDDARRPHARLAPYPEPHPETVRSARGDVGYEPFLATLLAQNDARVWACARVCPETFHARYSATARTYVYRLRVSPAHRPPSVFEKGKVWHVVRDEPLDVNAMRRRRGS